MTLRNRLRRFSGRARGRAHKKLATPSKGDLREFVYLDEVSLRSLLSSLTGEMTEGKSEQLSAQEQVELAGTMGLHNPLVAKAEVSSRFQTSNSSTIQTSRKATVQSWFRELHGIPNLRLIEPTSSCGPVADQASLVATANTSLVAKSGDLQRGELVEFKVKLAADPVYHLRTMVSEFTGMAADYPEMFTADDALGSLHEVEAINKILERLLTGLIPIRAVAVDYSVVTIGEVDYVVLNDLLQSLDLKPEPLEIVGVTEHLAYWKDLRRVLFSDAEFTVLGRVARSGLQRTWTPVKLADLFQNIAPGLVNQIAEAGRAPFAAPPLGALVNTADERLATALGSYAQALCSDNGRVFSEIERAALEARIVEVRTRSRSASDQRSAFAAVSALVKELAEVDIDPTRDLELREEARIAAGLSLFPALASNGFGARQGDASVTGSHREEHLLDIEVIAIYW